MKKIIYYLIIPILLCIPYATKAQYIQQNGIYYYILSTTDHTVEVCFGNSPYRGQIDIPATVTDNGITYDVVALGASAFEEATITSITIPSSVTQIKTQCFFYASRLTSISIPASVTNIELAAFAATSLSAVNVDENNPCYRTIDGMVFSKDSTRLVACPAGKVGAVSLPESVKYIEPAAFFICRSITNITLPRTLISIGNQAFGGCSTLNNISIPSTVIYIGGDLFGGCYSLNNLTMEQGNTHYLMDGYAIYSANGDTLVSYHKSADSVYLPNTLRVVQGFSNNIDIRYVNVPNSVDIIAPLAFYSSALESIDLPEQMTLIDAEAFESCVALNRIRMPTTLDSIGHNCFTLCSRFQSIDIPNGLRTIPSQTFAHCLALSEITWGDAVEIIDTSSFIRCNFHELHFPPTLRSIRAGSFNRFSAGQVDRVIFSAPIDTIEVLSFFYYRIKRFELKNTIPPVVTLDGGYGCFDKVTAVDSIIIPCGSLNAYLEHEYWGRFAGRYYEDCNGIEESPVEDIEIFPIPATNRLTITNASGCRQIEFINALGQIVLTKTLSGNSSDIDITALDRGAYHLRLYTNNGIITKKVVLQ